MNLGFIGVGKIASSVITGICSSNLKYKKIIISPRNKILSKKLKKKYKKIIIAKNNQEILNSCDWVFLAVTPEVGRKIIKKLKFRSNQILISFISTITFLELKKMIKIKNIEIVRVIPLPPIALKKGPIPIFPPNKKVKDFFNRLGNAIEINNEKLSVNFWSISGMMASFYEMLRVLSDWLIKNGIKKRIDAQKYITSLFLALSEDAFLNANKDLKFLVKDSQTPKGLNEQGLKELTKLGTYKSITKVLNNIHKRLSK